ncbi:MAG: ABC transporter substrate-binding protein [Micromonosporaceae bacterium]
MHAQDRRGFLRLSGAVAAGAAMASACGKAERSSDPASDEPIRIGLVLLQEGVFKLLGDDQRAAFKLYLELSGGLLGGRRVELVETEESLDPKVTVQNVEKLLKYEKVTALVGVTFSSNLIPVVPVVQRAKVPLISPYASTLQAQGKDYVWRTCALSGYDGYAIAKYVSERHRGEGVYLLASDYAAGWDEIAGFKKRFTGRIVGEEYIPFPDTVKFGRYLDRLRDSGAGALFCFLPADLAVAFIKQFDKAGLRDKVSFYGAEGMTEQPFLDEEGESARNLMDAFYYSEVLDNAPNRTFVAAYQRKYGKSPYVLPMVAYDAAAVLDHAIGGARHLTPEVLEQRIGGIGQLDSPRGFWSFGQNRAPVQQYYLRQVRPDGHVLSNVVLDDLEMVGDLPLTPAKAPNHTPNT